MTKFITLYLLPPLLIMGLIFFSSAQPSIQVSQSSTYDFLAHKLAHIFLYALLYFLWFRYFYKWYRLSHQPTPKKTLPNSNYIYAIVICVLYGISDELHQTFVPTRSGRVLDVFIDSFGIAIAFMYTKYYRQKIKFLL